MSQEVLGSIDDESAGHHDYPSALFGLCLAAVPGARRSCPGPAAAIARRTRTFSIAPYLGTAFGEAAPKLTGPDWLYRPPSRHLAQALDASGTCSQLG